MIRLKADEKPLPLGCGNDKSNVRWIHPLIQPSKESWEGCHQIQQSASATLVGWCSSLKPAFYSQQHSGDLIDAHQAVSESGQLN